MLTSENATLLSEIGVEHPETVSEFRMMRDTLNDLMNAVRREEREQAIAVLRPFARAAYAFSHESWSNTDSLLLECNGRIVPNTSVSVGSFRAASDYFTQAQGGENDHSVG